MIVNSIRDKLNRHPFEPFHIRSSSGKSYLIASPDLVVLMKTEIFVAAPNSDRSAQIPYLHVASLEMNSNGHAKRTKRKRK